MTAHPIARRVLVVGAGLIGTSLALALRRRWPSARITGMDLEPALEGRAPGAFDELRPSAADLPAVDLAVLACPVDAMPPWMGRLAATPGPTVVTDVGGVKRAPCDAARAAGLTHFVGGHPMAGAAEAGPRLASATLFDGQPWFLVTADAPADAVSLTRALVEACGAVCVEVAADEHDASVAALSHLPQVVSSLLMSVVAESAGNDALTHAGPGLRDVTRLAASPAAVWLPVLSANRDLLRPLLEALAERLRDTSAALADPDALRAVFDEANRARRRLTPSL